MDYRIVPGYKGETRPSLEPAKYRCAQAVERLNDLTGIADALNRKVQMHPLQVQFRREDVAAGEPTPILRWDGRAFPSDLLAQAKMTAGEVLYHLRTALEYTAYQLVWLDSGRQHRRCQFPIVSSESEWTPKLLSDRLKGLKDHHVAQVRGFQPFAGCDWIEGLREVSNADKHRVVLRLGVQFGATFPDEVTLIDDPDDLDEYRVETTPLTAVLQGEDEWPALPKLRDYLAGVVDVVNTFSPSFGEAADVRLA